MRGVVIRADGSLELGHGHVFRTLVLAEELANRGWKVSYVCRNLEGAPLSRIRAAGCDLVLLGADIDEEADAEETARAAADTKASWIVVDRYATNEKAHLLWRERGLKVLAIDDICEHRFDVDILLNQNTDAEGLPYETSPDTVRLFGPKYVLVREEYHKARPPAPRVIEEVRRVMVFMGGGDPGDATGKVLAALNGIDRTFDVEVVVGGAYPHLERLAEAAARSRHRVEIHRDLPDLVGPMSRADAAIAAGGSVTWELCCMGVPMLLMPIADNQEGIAASLERLGAAIRVRESGGLERLGKWLAAASRATAMAQAAYSLADGQGAQLAADHMEGRQ